LALKKGNFYIGTGDVGKGPTSSTGYYNGVTPPSGGYTIYLNKASDGPAIYTASNEAQLTAITNTISVSTNLIKNNNGGNFADGTLAPFAGAYGTLPTVVDITNDRPYNGSTSTKAMKIVAGGGTAIYTEPSPFTMTVGVTYTFSFWYRQTNANQFYIAFNNQGGSGDMNGNFQAYSASGYFPNPTQTWQRCSWTFTNVVNKVYFFIYSSNSVAGAECLMTEFTLTEGSMPGGPGLTTSGNCLNWFSTQTDKIIFNRDYESIVTSGLTLNLDAGFSPSFATIPSNANSSTVTPWYDLSLSGNNGTLTNGPTYNSDNGGSILFDGTNDYIINSNFNPSPINNELCISLWYKTLNNGSEDMLIDLCGITNTTANRDFFSIRQNWNSNGKISCYFNSTNGFQFVAFPNQVTTNTWNNIVYSKVGNTLYAYLNGVNVASQNVSGNIQTIQRYIIANDNLFQGNIFYGNMATILIYNRGLLANEVLQNYNATKGRFGL
jgi:hypothetical protein